MESRLQEMSLITGDGKLKKITKKCCKNCVKYHEFAQHEYMGDCSVSQRTTMQNDICGCYKGKEKKNENFNDDACSDRGSERI